METIGRTLGWMRLGIGVAAVLAPVPMVRLSRVLPRGQAPQTAFVRSFAIREILVGVLQARATGAEARRWLLLGASVDGADAVAIAMAVAKGQAQRRALLFSGSAAVAAIAAALAAAEAR